MPQQRQRRPRRALALILALAAALALTACAPRSPDTIPLTVGPSASGTETAGPSDSTPTATPLTVEPYVTPAPQSTSEAIRYASGAIQHYYDSHIAAMADPVQAEALSIVAAGDALANDLKIAENLVSTGAVLTGRLVFTTDMSASYVEDAINTETGEVLEQYGYVTMLGCQDQSRVSIVYSDGTTSSVGSQPRVAVRAIVIYSSTDESWRVFDMRITNGGEEAC